MMWISSRPLLLSLCVVAFAHLLPLGFTGLAGAAPTPEEVLSTCGSLAEVDVVLADADGNRAVVRYGNGSLAVVSPWQPVCAEAHVVAVRRGGLEVAETVVDAAGDARRQRVWIEVRREGNRSQRTVLDPASAPRVGAPPSAPDVDAKSVQEDR